MDGSRAYAAVVSAGGEGGGREVYVKLNRRTIIALTGLSLSTGYWCIDQFVLPPPASSNAAESASEEAGESKGTSGVTGGKDDSAWLRGLVERLKGLSSGSANQSPATTARDPFDRAVLRPVDGSAKPAESDGAARNLEFLSSRRLTATILGPNPMAVVDRRTLRIGDMVDGFRLDRIERGWVEFVSGPARLRLEVPGSGRLRGD